MKSILFGVQFAVDDAIEAKLRAVLDEEGAGIPADIKDRLIAMQMITLAFKSVDDAIETMFAKGMTAPFGQTLMGIDTTGEKGAFRLVMPEAIVASDGLPFDIPTPAQTAH